MNSIRYGRLEDLPEIVRIYNESIPGRRSTADLEPVSVDSKREWFSRHDDQRRPVYVLEAAGEIAGWLSLEWFYQGRSAYNATAEISVYISSSHQQKGYGRLLLDHAINDCPRLGVKNLISMHFDHNEGTKALIRKFGFTDAGHLSEIADIGGQPRGLLLGLLKLP